MLRTLRYLHRAHKYRFRNDRTEIAFLRARLARGMVVLDIGAHKGAYLYWLRRGVGREGRVVAFEPQPRLAAYLDGIVRRMRWRNVTVEHAGVSSIAGTLDLIVPTGAGDTSPGATFVTAKRAEPHLAHRVPVVTLDGYVHDHGLARVDVIKCDVEGHELEVFRGGTEVLGRDGPVILFECERRHLDAVAMTDVFAFLEDLGYSGCFFGRDGLEPVGSFDPDRHQVRDGERFWEAPGYANNFVFER